jgi:hypothetical protein
MNIKADARYNGIVAPGSQLYETQTGTLGYQVMLECADGSTSFVIWLTRKHQVRLVSLFRVCESWQNASAKVLRLIVQRNFRLVA